MERMVSGKNQMYSVDQLKSFLFVNRQVCFWTKAKYLTEKEQNKYLKHTRETE